VRCTGQQQNEAFFHYQKDEYGTVGHVSNPNPDGWIASSAACELIETVSACIDGYLECIAAHAGTTDAAEEGSGVDPDMLQVWASVHEGGSNHGRHVHYGAVASAVFYLNTPPGAGQICFYDPRGDIPPFDREIRHTPSAGELLIFPPWLSHAVASTYHGDEQGDDKGGSRPRISISFNLVDESIEGGRHGWGKATTEMDVSLLESDLGLELRHSEDENLDAMD
jgi:hypothetical protein